MSELFRYFTPYQIAWINETAPVTGAEKSRRIGWTYADAFRETINRAGANPTFTWNHWYSSADLTAAEEYIGYCADFARMVDAVAQVMDGVENVTDESGETTTITTKKLVFDNGLKITAGSSNPKFFRSKGGSVGLDELAFHPQGREIYKAAHATARFWGYPLRFWSSHNGPGSYFNGLVAQANAGKLRAKIHRVTVLDAVEQGIVERIRMRKDRLADVPAVDLKARQEWLDGLRAECPDEDVWNEEYLCIPASDASSLLSYELIRLAVVENLKLFASPADLPTDKGEYYAGYDVGRRHDLSVLWVAERVGDVLWTRLLRVLDRQTFSAQQLLLNALMRNPRVRRLCIDETGLGMQLAEQTKQRWGSRVEGVTLSGPAKASLGMTFKDRFIDRGIRLPGYVDWETAGDAGLRGTAPSHNPDWLVEDLHKTKKSVTAAGNVRLAADSDADGHADGFWAGALMNEAASDAAGVPRVKGLKEVPMGW